MITNNRLYKCIIYSWQILQKETYNTYVLWLMITKYMPQKATKRARKRNKKKNKKWYFSSLYGHTPVYGEHKSGYGNKVKFTQLLKDAKMVVDLVYYTKDLRNKL